MSDTPRTDAKEKETEHRSDEEHAHYGWKFARTLETELAALTRERVAAAVAMKMAAEERDAAQYGLDRLGAELEAAHAASEALQPGIDHLRETCDALERELDEARQLAQSNLDAYREARDQRDALRAEVERLTGCLKRANDQAEEFERKWYLRGDEVERLRKDAARYQWLRDPNNDTEGTAPFLAGDDLDAAIDAALQEPTP